MDLYAGIGYYTLPAWSTAGPPWCTLASGTRGDRGTQVGPESNGVEVSALCTRATADSQASL